MENIYHKYWEQELTYQFIADNRCRKKAYICSPLSAVNEEDFVENMRAARAYMFYAMKKMDLYARAPHAYLPMLLCDAVPAERAVALQFGLRLLEESDMLLACGNRLSKGMRGEITHAAALNIPILTFDEGLYLEIRKLVTQHGGNKKNVRMDREHSLLGLSDPVSGMKGR